MLSRGMTIIRPFITKGKFLYGKRFGRLGNETEVSDELQKDLDKAVCLFYGQRKSSDVNDARYRIFWSNKRGKIVDLCFLPLCRASLQLHVQLASYVARMWWLADQPILSLPPISNHGWTNDFRIKWVETPYPDELSDPLVQLDDEIDLDSRENVDDELFDDVNGDAERYSIEHFADHVFADLL
ncbi:hypothetical protein SNE40_013258 [Patella caerulea]|uniref:Uncharacterized protein n=1 Tax=Patella caerulea TaxID=87958 RepID=A0AAN8JJ80_PATCE